eukprot:gnl/MRDRNA2_/MRDRNA2_214656_c0_seq1.p1 gnl/MRDRNA2_/MRDRNA2_214656_c0~~gnl/MRDRNA2_/MRDRNA2_214656_c0_seq1.p1  ORF type:complete len:301 (+),score=52.13 gnl/MRDRNA2_/MRDRNA2_214656_c0_seq1:37-939(+)
MKKLFEKLPIPTFCSAAEPSQREKHAVTPIPEPVDTSSYVNSYGFPQAPSRFPAPTDGNDMTLEEWNLECARRDHNSYLRGYTDPVVGGSSSSSRFDSLDSGTRNEQPPACSNAVEPPHVGVDAASNTEHRQDVEAECQHPGATSKIVESSSEEDLFKNRGLQVITSPKLDQPADVTGELKDRLVPTLNLCTAAKVEESSCSPRQRFAISNWPPDSPKSARTPRRSGRDRTLSDDRTALSAREKPSVSKWFQQMIKQKEEAAEKASEKGDRRSSCQPSVFVAEKIYHIEYQVAEREAMNI